MFCLCDPAAHSLAISQRIKTGPRWTHYRYTDEVQQTSPTSAAEPRNLLGGLFAFCFPGGEDAARLVRVIRTTQQGEIRMSPQARWIPFTAEEVTDATRSNFRWEARFNPGKIISTAVTDAYEEGRGRLVIKVAGVPMQKMAGPDLDRGELQRYLSSIAFCPPILINHPSLEITAIGPLTLRVRDREDSTGASVDVGLSEEGQPLTCCADRPRMVGKQTVMTPWSGSCTEFRDWQGLRVATLTEVRWHLPEGPFTYYRSEITSFTALR